jgi:hypothetical protein
LLDFGLVAEFQSLMLQETGMRLSKEEAREQASSLIWLVDFVMRPGR